jgi:hypothetical protein
MGLSTILVRGPAKAEVMVCNLRLPGIFRTLYRLKRPVQNLIILTLPALI